MSDFGLFEATVVEDSAPEVQQRVASRRLEAAIYDVHQVYGRFLLGATGLDEFEDRWHYSKNDIRKTVEPHLMPVTGVMRRVHDAMKKQWKESFRKGAPFADYQDFADCTSKNSDKNDPDAYCGEIKHKTEDKKSSRRLAALTGPDQHLEETFHPSEGNLIPEDNFGGYLDDVDQGGPEKVQGHDFGIGGDTGRDKPHEGRLALDLYSDWAHSNGLRVASTSTLVLYSDNCTDDEYRQIHAAIKQAGDEDDDEGPPSDDDDHEKDRDEKDRDDKDDDSDDEDDDEGDDKGDKDKGGDDKDDKNDDGGPPWLTSRRMSYLEQLAAEDDEAAQTPAPEPAPQDPSAAPPAPASDTAPQAPAPDQPPVDASQPPAPLENQPAEDHLLDTANDAVTQMIDRETQEYQQLIDPLTQALQAIEFAQQVEQQANPLDVTPPEGTVDVGPQEPATGMPDPSQQMPPQPPPQQRAAALRDQALRIANAYHMTPGGYQAVLTAMGRRHYQQVADAIAGLPSIHRGPIAASLGDMFKEENPAFRHEPFFAAAGVASRGRLGFNQLADAGSLTPTHTLDVFEFPNAQHRPKDNLTITPDDMTSLTPKKGSLTRREAKAIEEEWQSFSKDRAQKGLNLSDTVNLDAFKTQNQGKFGPKAVEHLERVVGVPPSAPSAPSKGKVTAAKQGFFTRRVPGWTWNDHLAAYTSNSAAPFTCHCGSMFDVPSYYNCRCGKVFNSYPIGSGGDDRTASIDMYLCREIQVRPEMIMASRKMACGCGTSPCSCKTEWVEDEDREDADAPHAPGKNAAYRLADGGFDITTDPGIQNDVRANYPGLMQPSAVPGTVGIPTDQQKALVGQPSTGFPSKISAIGEDDHSVVYRDGDRYCSKCGALLWDPNVHHCPAKQAALDDDDDEPTKPPKDDEDRDYTITDKQRKKVEKGEQPGPEDVGMEEHIKGKDKKKESAFFYADALVAPDVAGAGGSTLPTPQTSPATDGLTHTEFDSAGSGMSMASRHFADWTKYDDDLDSYSGPSVAPTTDVRRPPPDWARRDEKSRWIGPAIPPKPVLG